MKKQLKHLALGLILVSVSACGPLSQNSVASQLGQAVATGLIGGAEQEAGNPTTSRDDSLNNTGQFILVNIRNQNRWDTAVRSGSNGNRSTWVDSTNTSVTLENGIVVATRGLRRDLIAADVSEVWRAIRQGGGEAQRVHEFLTNIDGISTELLQCRIVSEGPETIDQQQRRRNTTRFTEECKSKRLQFANVYWVNDAGVIIRSLQAASAEAGYLQIDIF